MLSTINSGIITKEITMSVIYGPTETIDWRDKQYIIQRQPMPKDELDNDNAWQIKLHDFHPDDAWVHTELWVKWDGLAVKRLQLIHGFDYGMHSRDDYLAPEELHDFVHAYANVNGLTSEQKAYALDGLELALHLVHAE